MEVEDIALEDLYKFIRIGNRSLLIKGRSGTGKATLSFEIAKMYKDKFKTIFISRKISELELYKRYPWIREFVRSENIFSIAESEGIFADNPLFTITNLLNTLTNLTTRIDDPFVTIKGSIKPLIILDAWDSITKEIDLATKIKIEKALLSLTDKHIGFIIFITEDLEDTSLEYMIDGIVRLEQKFFRAYRLREMHIEKLKGTHITKPKVPFTLEGGRFRTFYSISHNMYDKSGIFEYTLHNDNYFSSGNPELDDRLHGGFRKGAIVSLEIDEEVDRFVFVPLLAPIVLNFIEQKCSAVIILSQDQHVSAVTKYLIPYSKEENRNNYLRVIGSNIDEVAPYVLPLVSKDFVDIYNIWLSCYKDLKQKTKNCVVSIDYSFVELEYRDKIEDILKSIIDLCRLIRAEEDLLIITSRPNYKTMEVIKSVSDLHFKIFEYDSAIMLASIKPQLFLCNIQTDYSKGYPNARLLEST